MDVDFERGFCCPSPLNFWCNHLVWMKLHSEKWWFSMILSYFIMDFIMDFPWLFPDFFPHDSPRRPLPPAAFLGAPAASPPLKAPEGAGIGRVYPASLGVECQWEKNRNIEISEWCVFVFFFFFFFPYSFCPWKRFSIPLRDFDMTSWVRKIYMCLKIEVYPPKYHYNPLYSIFMENYGKPLDVGIFPWNFSELLSHARFRKSTWSSALASTTDVRAGPWCSRCLGLHTEVPCRMQWGGDDDGDWTDSVLQQAIMGNSPNTGRYLIF